MRAGPRSRSSAPASMRGSPRCPRSSAASCSTRSRSRSPSPASTTAETRPPRTRRSSSRDSPPPRLPSASLRAFTGADRRFQVLGALGGVTVVDDYGHNPTELRAALETARALGPRRLVALYVPHVVERTRQLHRELGDALGLADAAIVPDFVGQRDATARGCRRAARPRQRSRPDPPPLGADALRTAPASPFTSCGPATSFSRSAWGSPGARHARSSPACPTGRGAG